MHTFTGVIRGNQVLVNDDILPYDGYSAIVTVNEADKDIKRVDLSRFVIPTERGNHADEYIRELQDNDRF